MNKYRISKLFNKRLITFSHLNVIQFTNGENCRRIGLNNFYIFHQKKRKFLAEKIEIKGKISHMTF